MTGNPPLKVCFVSPHAYSLFDRSTHFVFGGAEVQAYLLATELVRRPGYDVHFVVYDHGQPRTQEMEGVQVTSYRGSFELVRQLLSRLGAQRGMKTRSAGPAQGTDGASARVGSLTPDGAPDKIEDRVGRERQFPKIEVKKNKGRVVRLKNHPLTLPLFHIIMIGQFFVDNFRFTLPMMIERVAWRWRTRLVDFEIAVYILDMKRYKTYREVDADIYIGFGANDLTGELTSFCRINEKKAILWSISDADFHDSYYHGSNIRNYYGDVGDRCHFALMRAHRWITQNTHQKKMAKEKFFRESVIISNPIDLGEQSGSPGARSDRRYALWIGKADATKQPAHFVALAKAFPDLEFFMVLNPSRATVEENVYAHCPDNLKIVDSVHREEVAALMETAFVLVNSSQFEGMPNVFLEACRAGTPLLSLNVDPNGFIAESGCGVSALGDMDAFRQGFDKLANDPDFWQETSTRALAYVRENHDQAKCVDRMITEIEAVRDLDEDEEVLIDLEQGGVSDNFVLRGSKWD